MKSTLLVIITMVSIYASNAGEPLSYAGIDSISGKSQNDLFSAARQWFSTTFNESKEVLDVQDKESGELVGKGVLRYVGDRASAIGFQGFIRFEVSVFVKDGRYKYVFTNFVHETVSDCIACPSIGLITTDTVSPHAYKGINKGMAAKNYKMIKARIEMELPKMVESLKAAMANAVSSDW